MTARLSVRELIQPFAIINFLILYIVCHLSLLACTNDNCLLNMDFLHNTWSLPIITYIQSQSILEIKTIQIIGHFFLIMDLSVVIISVYYILKWCIIKIKEYWGVISFVYILILTFDYFHTHVINLVKEY